MLDRFMFCGSPSLAYLINDKFSIAGIIAGVYQYQDISSGGLDFRPAGHSGILEFLNMARNSLLLGLMGSTTAWYFCHAALLPSD